MFEDVILVESYASEAFPEGLVSEVVRVLIDDLGQHTAALIVNDADGARHTDLTMPDLLTEITEIVTGLGTTGLADLPTALAARPATMRNVTDEHWDRLQYRLRAGPAPDRVRDSWANGRAFYESPDGLRGRPPLTIEWKGAHRATWLRVPACLTCGSTTSTSSAASTSQGSSPTAHPRICSFVALLIAASAWTAHPGMSDAHLMSISTSTTVFAATSGSISCHPRRSS